MRKLRDEFDGTCVSKSRESWNAYPDRKTGELRPAGERVYVHVVKDTSEAPIPVQLPPGGNADSIPLNKAMRFDVEVWPGRQNDLAFTLVSCSPAGPGK